MRDWMRAGLEGVALEERNEEKGRWRKRGWGGRALDQGALAVGIALDCGAEEEQERAKIFKIRERGDKFCSRLSITP